MKRILLTILLLIPFLTKAQGFFGGTSVNEYKASNGVTYHVGDTVRLGRGTKSDGTFMYFEDHGLIPNPRSTRNLPKDFANAGATIKSIRKMKVNGIEKYLFSVNPGGPMRYTVFIDDAIEACEVKPCKAPDSAKPATAGSVADEIKKLKELLDSGAITKDEYEAQKKKLLGN